ncbi:MAG: TetR/AcrR family transcriptional regulator C-terminal domain-containing protein [Clostridia bacterium]
MSDLRTIRTYKLLKNALLELLSKQSFDTIKVIDICDLAMIHRTTFYSHFSDKYELLDYVIKDIENELLSGFNVAKYSSSREFYKALVMNLLEYLGSNKLFFRNMLNNNYGAGIITVFHNSAIKYITDLIEKESNSGKIFNVPSVVMAEFYSGAVTSTIMWWLKTNSKISEKVLCDQIISLIFDEQK